MKTILGTCMLCVLIASPALSELTQADLDKIRLIVNESEKRVKEEIKKELKPIKADIGALKVEVASLSGRVDGIDKMMTWLMVLIVVAVCIPHNTASKVFGKPIKNIPRRFLPPVHCSRWVRRRRSIFY